MKNTCYLILTLALALAGCDTEPTGDEVCVLPYDADEVAGQCNSTALGCELGAQQTYNNCLSQEIPTEYDEVLGVSSATCAGYAIQRLRGCYGYTAAWCVDQQNLSECSWTCEAARAECIDRVIGADLADVSWEYAASLCSSDACIAACRG